MITRAGAQPGSNKTLLFEPGITCVCGILTCLLCYMFGYDLILTSSPNAKFFPGIEVAVKLEAPEI